MENKLTEADIKSVVVSETFTLLPSGKCIVCELMLKNGYSVIGSDAVVDIANFDKIIGETIARENAIDKIWQLEWYLLQEKLYKNKEGK